MTWILSAFADEAGSSIDEQVAACTTAGLKYLDLRVVNGINISELPLDTAQQVQGKLNNAGLRVNMLGSPIGKIDIAEKFQGDLELLQHLAELSEVFDCKQVRVFSYYNRAGADEEKWAEGSIDRLRQLTEQASELGLVLFIENELGLYGQTLQRVARLAETCRDGQTCRMIFDFDNYNQAGEDLWQVWVQLRNCTDAFHLKDSTAPPEPMHVPIGQGNSRARDILYDAQRSGWSGCLSVEPHLTHSAAVASIGRAGQTNQAMKDLGPAECFQVATAAAGQLLHEIGATFE